MIAVIDYGVGNLFSLCRSLEAIGQEPLVTGDAESLRQADRLILPGVGAFADAAEKLRATGLDQVLREEAGRGKPILGICLGMQLLFEESHEFGRCPGLGLIPGKVVPMEGVIPPDYKIPHIGWNALDFPQGKQHPLLRTVQAGDCVYFVHSFWARRLHCHHGIRRGAHRRRGPRKRDGLPVPPGEERGRGLADFTDIL